ncbi:MAG: hypothetical protein K6F82_01255 [Sphaerochaetaceae bacterium]|nr:hypothetical protein [Sphaerochaetaceae bacterium]
MSKEKNYLVTTFDIITINKKIFLILLSVLLIFAFTSCDSNVESSDEISDAETPLTLENAGSTDATINVIIVGYSSNDVNLKYSIDGGTKTAITSTETEENISLPAGSTISFYGDRTTDGTSSKYVMINCSAECYVYGNVMSLLDSDEFSSLTSTTYDYAFYRLFYKHDGNYIKNHTSKALVLPATDLVDSCYFCMFYGCTRYRNKVFLQKFKCR